MLSNYNFFYSCFIGEPGVFFGAFLGPIFAILLFNATIFVIITSVLIKHSQKRFSSKDKAKRQRVARLMISIMGVMALFGLMWIFGALTIREASTAFQFLFAIFNSLQGFFIFLFFCAFGKDGRELWLHMLCCGRKIPGIKVSIHSNIKQRKFITPRKLSQPNTTSTYLRSAPPTSFRNTAFQLSSVAHQSNVFSESESIHGMSNPTALQLERLEESQIDKPHLAEVYPNAEKQSSFLYSSAKEVEITGDEQHKNGSTPPAAEVPDLNAMHLPVLVSSCHDVKTYSGDNEDESESKIIVNPNIETF